MEDKPLYENQGIRRQGRNVQDRKKVNVSPELAELIAGFHPVIGPALSAKDFEVARQEGDKLGMGMAAAGMMPIAGGAVRAGKRAAKSGYEAFSHLFTNEAPQKVKNFFATGRNPNNPSLYAHMDDASTQAYREPSNRTGTGHKMQNKSIKTVFVEDPESIGRAYQNKDTHTRLIPTADNKLQVVAQDSGNSMFHGDFKKGQVLEETPFELHPREGLHPVEVFGDVESPIGKKGGDVHFGSKITEVVNPEDFYKTFKSGGAVNMPKSYSKGSWKLI
jgi:hypothetical protein